MSTQEFLEKLQRVQLNIATDDTPLKLGSYSAIALQSKRIFTDGLKTDGSQIGQYSTTPAYFTASQARQKSAVTPPTGKTGKDTFASTGQKHKSKFFDGGYKEFRAEQGLNSDYINLDYHGDLKSDFENIKGGFPTTRKVSNQEYITSIFARKDNVKKWEGLQERFGIIGNLTTTEKEAFYKTVRFELRKLIAAA